VSNLEEKFDKLASDFLDNISDIAALREQLQVPAPGPSIVVVGLQDVWKKWHKDECANFEHWEVTAADGVTAKVFTGLSPVVAEVAFTEFINAIKPGDRYRIRFYQRPDPSSSYTEKKTFQFEL
jgi:hypothetical protein